MAELKVWGKDYGKEQHARPSTDVVPVDKRSKFGESVDDLNDFFDVSKSIEIPVPSLKMHKRFETSGPKGDKIFIYRVRESFRELLNTVLFFFDGNKQRYPELRYTGNIGAGKSHNLAALAHYLRRLQSFNLSVVYISSCAQLFENYICHMKIALCETFPDEEAMISDFGDHQAFCKYIGEKQSSSIIFIFDDWNYVHQEGKLGIVDNQERLDSRRKLLELSSEQYRIEAISAGSESLITDSKANLEPNDPSSLHLFGGLTKLEWSAWKQTSWLFREISDEEEEVVIHITGLVPLYLKALEGYRDGDLRERIRTFDDDTGSNIASSLLKSSIAFCAESQQLVEPFIAQMTAALNESSPPCRINYSLYDHRFFYRDLKNNILRPISGLVRRCMRDFLDVHYLAQFRRRITAVWVEAALRSANPSVRGFAFEEYALLQILRYPEQYLGERVPQGTECNLVRFCGDFPEKDQLNTEGLTMFWPEKFNLSHVDAVLRYVPPAGQQERGFPRSTLLYGVQVTLRSPDAHKSSFNFFLQSVGKSEKYLTPEETETATRYLLWMTVPVANALQMPSTSRKPDAPAPPPPTSRGPKFFAFEQKVECISLAM